MPDHEPAREYIHAMIGHRTRISEAERDILHQLLDTPAVHAGGAERGEPGIDGR